MQLFGRWTREPACENYNECARNIVVSEHDASKKNDLVRLCIFKHERPLDDIELNRINVSASLKKKLGSSFIYEFSSTVKNNTSSIFVTEIEFNVIVRAKDMRQNFTIFTKVFLMPGEAKEITFYEDPDLIMLKSDIGNDDWDFVIKAKGVSLR